MGNTILAADLHRILTDVRPFASTDKLLPQLMQVRIETAGGNMVAVTTDRFTLGASRADYCGEELAANISLSNIDNLIRIAKTSKKDAGWRSVEVRIHGGHPNSIEFIFSTGETLTVQAEQTDFPRWQQLLPADNIHAGDQTDAAMAYNGARLAKFAKVAGSDEMRLVSRGRAKPALVCIGTDFVGVIMPVRAEGEVGFNRAAWIA